MSVAPPAPGQPPAPDQFAGQQYLPPPPPAYAPPPYAGPYQAPQTSGLAIASFVLSLLWFAGLGSLLAVIFGIRSRREIRLAGGAKSGDGLAVAGLVIGIVGMVGAVLLWASLALAFLGQSAENQFQQVGCQVNQPAYTQDCPATTVP